MSYAFEDPRAVRIGRLLCLEGADDMSDTGLALRIGTGLPVESADHLYGGLTSGLTVDWPISDSTMRRARQGSQVLSREHSERLYEMSRVLDAALRAYSGDNEKAQAFLSRAHPLLDGQVPFTLARTSSAGADAVVALLERAMAGVSV